MFLFQNLNTFVTNSTTYYQIIMKKSDSLFLLIKGLTKAEKRHLKLSISKYQSVTDKSYVQLFNALDEQDVYDEKAIKNKFKDDPYFNHLPRFKVYLYEKILNSLRAFHSEASVELRLNNYLTEIEILYKKELFEDCADRVKKAKGYAEKYEKFAHLLKIISWQSKVADHVNNLAQVETLKKGGIEEEKELLSKYVKIPELRRIYLESRYITQSIGEARTTEETKEHDDLMQLPVMQKELNFFDGEHLRLVVMSHNASLKRDFKQMHVVLKKAINLFESQPHQIEERLNIYVGNILILAKSCCYIHKYNEAESYLQKLKKLVERFPDSVFIKFRMRIMDIEVSLYEHRGEYDKAAQKIEDIDLFLEQHHFTLEPIDELAYYFTGLSVHFGTGDFKKVHVLLQAIFNFQHPKLRADLQWHARIINLIVQYEQGEYEHLGYVLRSTYRYLLKRKGKYQLEIILLDFIKKACNIRSHAQMIDALAKVKEQIIPYADVPFERNFFYVFPIVEWLDSKLQKRSLSDIMQVKYQQAIATEDLKEISLVV
jgi:hypothetical protein